MKIVISCCDRKNGDLFKYNGVSVNFVSQIKGISKEKELNVRPDDKVLGESITWRELISRQESLKEVLPAYKLYAPGIYKSLYDKYGTDFYIFSAGWGIVRADYKLPKYNITFSKSQSVPTYAKRNKEDVFHDFNHLEGIDRDEEIILIAGKDYVLPFCQLTCSFPNKKIVIYTSKDLLKNNPYIKDDNFQFRHYQTTTRTNWHYGFAQKLINNHIRI
jgi:hypothetical protein